MMEGLERGRAVWFFAVGLLGCTSSWGDAPLETVEAEGQVVVTLQARDAEVTISSTTRGVRYSVRDERGGIQPALTLAQLHDLDPHLFELVRSATASGVLGGPGNAEGGVLDASLVGLPSRAQPVGSPVLDASRRR